MPAVGQLLCWCPQPTCGLSHALRRRSPSLCHRQRCWGTEELGQEHAAVEGGVQPDRTASTLSGSAGPKAEAQGRGAAGGQAAWSHSELLASSLGWGRCTAWDHRRPPPTPGSFPFPLPSRTISDRPLQRVTFLPIPLTKGQSDGNFRQAPSPTGPFQRRRPQMTFLVAGNRPSALREPWFPVFPCCSSVSFPPSVVLPLGYTMESSGDS